MPYKTIDDIDVRSKRVLMRVDFNVPLDDQGRITDDRRIELALPSIRSVLERGGRLVLMSHLGRPAGTGFEAAFSLRPAADRLAALLPRASVTLAPDGPATDAARAAVESMGDGAIVVLENLRFDAGEKKGDAGFASRLAALGDVYCNEAFGTAHRADASMVAVPRAMRDRPRVAGRLLARELRYLGDVLARPESPFAAVLGGAKVSDKLGAIDHLLGRVDQVVIGGAMAYTFLAAHGTAVGASRVETDRIDEARSILAAAAERGTEVVLPSDHVAGRALEPGTETRPFEGGIDPGWMGLDIGPRTAAAYGERLRSCRTIVWNGPMGVFEVPPFDAGSRRVAEAIVAATEAGAMSVVGGGDTAAAVESFGLDGGFSHVSTGGGASLRMLEGAALPGLEELEPTAEQHSDRSPSGVATGRPR